MGGCGCTAVDKKAFFFNTSLSAMPWTMVSIKGCGLIAAPAFSSSLIETRADWDLVTRHNKPRMK